MWLAHPDLVDNLPVHFSVVNSIAIFVIEGTNYNLRFDGVVDIVIPELQLFPNDDDRCSANGDDCACDAVRC